MAPQVVLMTGSSSGIGLATAQHLSQDPNKRFLVIATVISMAEKADLVAAVGGALDDTIFIHEMDITKDDQIDSTVNEVIKRHGQIDILLNIAGIRACGLPERLPRQQIDLAFNTNTIGAIRLTQAVLPHMKQKMAGRIISITSLAGRMATPYSEVYSASKFAVEGYFESLAVSVRSFNIWTCVVEPGPVPTGLLDGIIKDLANVAADESAHEIDRRQAKALVEATKSGYNKVTVKDIIPVLMNCIEAEKPVLRHQILPEQKTQVAHYGSDATGETGVADRRKKLLNLE